MLTGQGLAEFAKTKVGTPYVYGTRGSEGPLTMEKLQKLVVSYPSIFTIEYLTKIAQKNLIGQVCCDCSGLIEWYTGKNLPSSQLYSTAYARMPISEYEKFAIGTVLWKQGHVGVYIGDGLVVEERGIDYGCIISKIGDQKWVYGLTFSWMDYNIETPVESSKITYKTENPYKDNNALMSIGAKGEPVKWLQYELIEAGYTNLDITGEFDIITLVVLKTFQQLVNIPITGVVDNNTRQQLIANV